MSVNLFSILDIFENHYFISATSVCVLACMLYSIIKPFISAYVCVCVFVCLLFIKHF